MLTNQVHVMGKMLEWSGVVKASLLNPVFQLQSFIIS